MKLINKKLKISKKYLLKAALYRRMAMQTGGLDKQSELFNEDKLIELYHFESTGRTNDSNVTSLKQILKSNGYAYGKFLRDCFVSDMVKDVKSGLFFKCEFLSTPLERLHNQDVLDKFFVDPNQVKINWHKHKYVYANYKNAILKQFKVEQLESEIYFYKNYIGYVDELMENNELKDIHPQSMIFTCINSWKEKFGSLDKVKAYLQQQLNSFTHQYQQFNKGHIYHVA